MSSMATEYDKGQVSGSVAFPRKSSLCGENVWAGLCGVAGTKVGQMYDSRAAPGEEEKTTESGAWGQGVAKHGELGRYGQGHGDRGTVRAEARM